MELAKYRHAQGGAAGVTKGIASAVSVVSQLTGARLAQHQSKRVENVGT